MTDDLKFVKYGHGVRFTGAAKLFIPQVQSIQDAFSHEMELSTSVAFKRALGDALTREEEAYVKRADERAAWYDTHCECCGRPFQEEIDRS